MIAVKLILGEDIAAQLNKLGFEKVPDNTLTETGVWKTPWGHHFFVPELGPERACVETQFKGILAAAQATKPDGWKKRQH